MTLEVQLASLIEALTAQTAAQQETNRIWSELNSAAKRTQDVVKSGGAATAGGVEVIPPKVEETKPPKAEKAAKAEKPAATPPAPAPAPAAPAETESASASPSEVTDTSTDHSVTLEDVQAAMKLKVQDFRSEVVAVFAKFGVKKASELQPKDFQAALVALNAIGSAEEDLA